MPVHHNAQLLQQAHEVDATVGLCGFDHIGQAAALAEQGQQARQLALDGQQVTGRHATGQQNRWVGSRRLCLRIRRHIAAALGLSRSCLPLPPAEAVVLAIGFGFVQRCQACAPWRDADVLITVVTKQSPSEAGAAVAI